MGEVCEAKFYWQGLQCLAKQRLATNYRKKLDKCLKFDAL